jgi:putative ABC transport system permease protein
LWERCPVQYNILRSLDLRLGEARQRRLLRRVENQQAGIDSLIRAVQELIDETPIVASVVASINGKSATAIADEIDKNRRLRDSARPAGAGAAAAARGARWCAIDRAVGLSARVPVDLRDSLTASSGSCRASGPALGRHRGHTRPSLARFGHRGGMGVKLRDTITWNVQGVLIPTIVTSMRSIQWQTFAPNFFAVFDPKSLAAAPKQFAILVHASTPTAIAHLQRDVVARYPSISSLDLTLVQRTVQSVLGKVTMAVRFLALISLGLAVPVLFSAVAAARRTTVAPESALRRSARRPRSCGSCSPNTLRGTPARWPGVVVTLAAWGLLHVTKMSPGVRAGGDRGNDDDRAGGIDRVADGERCVRGDADGGAAGDVRPESRPRPL